MRHQKSQPLLLFDTFGSILRALRASTSLSQESLAGLLRVKRKTIERWEQNKAVPIVANLHDIAEFFGVAFCPLLMINSGHPVYFNPDTRRFSLSGPAESKLLADIDPPARQKFEKITSENVAAKILEYDHRIYSTSKPLDKTLIIEASRLFPEGCFIGSDAWGHYNAHVICLPLRDEAYSRIRNQELEEGELKVRDLCEPGSPNFACFYYYSVYACSDDVGSSAIRHALKSLGERAADGHVVAGYAVTRDGNSLARRLNMKAVFHDLDEYKRLDTDDVPTLWEMDPRSLINQWLAAPLIEKMPATPPKASSSPPATSTKTRSITRRASRTRSSSSTASGSRSS